ncbi:hypothetical protein BOX15_Mlig028513g1 [Macrostomum lignano]|uniref:Protein RER1 n=1 Tax=Macrostomum lignano TaxID=282301 RepID=A0A267E8Q5_9PLAT|nr:hypothetical protein BOX15_Mlig028513g1 [Macrostomum lignano]
MIDDLKSEQATKPPSAVSAFWHNISMRYQAALDKCTPFTTGRWVGFCLLFLLFALRILLVQGFYIIAYALGIYLLNLLIGFLTPMDAVSLDEDGPSLPTRASEEFRPFIRRLPEFKFWYSSTRATVISLFCTLVPAFDIPVFWPILVMYFFLLFTLTMKRQIKHMIKHRYIPFTYGKPQHKGREDNASPVGSQHAAKS